VRNGGSIGSDSERRALAGAASRDVEELPGSSPGVSRRRFLGYLIAGPTLLAGAQLNLPWASAAVPTHQPVDHYDLSDLLTDAARPTSNLITVGVNPDGTASFALPRAEVGQGITTAIAMTIAEEMDLPLEKVSVTLADARPELVWNQITGGSNTMHAMFTPVRVAAAIARGQLLQAAAEELGAQASQLSIHDGVISSPDGRNVPVGSLSERAAVSRTVSVRAQLKPPSQFKVVGTPRGRVDGRDIVTGRKRFALDLDVPNALPTMVCRPPTINGTPLSIKNLAKVKAMPGVTDVALMPHTPHVAGGVAVRGRTFGQCIDAIRALRVEWGPGTADGKSDADVLADLEQAEQPLPPAAPGGKSLDQRFTFHFRPGDPLETNCAIADVRSDSAEVWSTLKTPVWAQEQIAKDLGLPIDKVKVHVAEGGGSFGRHLFCDAAFEAAAISQKMGKPVRLRWHRADNFRQGRNHPMCTSRVRVSYSGDNVVSFDQRHTSVATDWSEGFGELLTAMGATPPGANANYSAGIFNLTANVPYDFGAVTQQLTEIYEYNTFNTSAVRNVYSPEVTTARELMVDRVAKELGHDPWRFRRDLARDSRMQAVLDRLAKAGRWGRPMRRGTAQGIGIHREYKGHAACLVEIDCRPATVKRHIHHGYSGPRVTKVVCVVDVGLPINPLGLRAQLMGGIMDGIAQTLTYSLHLRDGAFLEASWDDAFYTRQWNVPPKVKVIVMPPTTGDPGGAGELGVAPSMAAVACAYARATGKMPTSFPINHNRARLGFEPFPTVPPIPPSPTDGLKRVY
jgi:isoquinoline 1-oxidoreductase beta subunit